MIMSHTESVRAPRPQGTYVRRSVLEVFDFLRFLISPSVNFPSGRLTARFSKAFPEFEPFCFSGQNSGTQRVPWRRVSFPGEGGGSVISDEECKAE